MDGRTTGKSRPDRHSASTRCVLSRTQWYIPSQGEPPLVVGDPEPIGVVYSCDTTLDLCSSGG